MKTKKIIASLLTLGMMMLTMSSLLVSAETITPPVTTPLTSSDLTITNNPANTALSLEGTSFNLFRVFDATIMPDVKEEGIEYTVNTDFQGFFDGVFTQMVTDGTLAAAPVFGTAAYDNAALDYVHSFKTIVADKTVDNMQNLVPALRTYIITNAITPAATTTTGKKLLDQATIQSVHTQVGNLVGYFFILDSAASARQDGVIAAGALQTLPGRSGSGKLDTGVTIEIKGSKPTIDKDVWHNDVTKPESTDALPSTAPVTSKGSWDNVSDYHIGDTVHYRIKARIPSDMTGYKHYTYIVGDKLADGISFDEGSLAIYTNAELAGSPVAGNLHTSIPAEGYIFRLSFDMLAIKAAFPDLDYFYIYYTGTVTDTANIANQNDANGFDYEENTVDLTYSNNPYDEESFGYDDDTVYTYTFDINVFKTEGDATTGLGGAVFALYKIGATSEGVEELMFLEKKVVNGIDTYYPVTGKTPSTDPASMAGMITTMGDPNHPTEFDGKFNIIGLDDAITYRLEEIDAPDGYNIADPITFTLKAAYANDTAGVPSPTLTSTSKVFENQTNDLSTTIVNTSSALLPNTGGTGTTLFFVFGGVMMLGACVMLIVTRKTSKEEEQ